MKKTVVLFLMLFLHISLTFAQSSSAYYALLRTLYKGTVPLAMMDVVVKKNGNTVLLDAREWKEYQVSHLKGARWIGYDNFKISAIKDIPKNTHIIVYCSVGYRSERIGEQLKAAGYTQVQNLYGGIFEWINAGLEVIDAAGKKTNKVHGYNKLWGKWVEKGVVVY
ncbi:MAG: rhodanese-like domain-containing protein [Bacteroidia bacterium]